MPKTFSKGSDLRARVYDVVCGWEERWGLIAHRRALVEDLTGDVVELGAGTGKNFAFYSEDARVAGSDFDPVMLRRAVDRAAEARAEVTLFLADAMALPFPDASVDTIVVGLMLCSVPDQATALAEVRRVLKPRGRFRFLEHVRDDDGSARAWVQDRVNPVWRRVSGGCNANRRTAEAVEAAGFVLTHLERFRFGAYHIAPKVLAEATVR